MAKARAERWHEESEKLGALEGLALGLLIAFGFIFLMFVGSCKGAVFEEKEPVVYESKFLNEQISDILDPREIPVLGGIVFNEPEPEPEVEEEYYEEPYYEEYYEEEYYESGYSGDGFMQAGVREGVDSDTETWYSSNALYHYRTPEWSPDDEGYYRDSDGYYVVASDDYPEGSVVMTSKGEAKVYDSGTNSGNIDMYVAW